MLQQAITNFVGTNEKTENLSKKKINYFKKANEKYRTEECNIRNKNLLNRLSYRVEIKEARVIVPEGRSRQFIYVEQQKEERLNKK